MFVVLAERQQESLESLIRSQLKYSEHKPSLKMITAKRSDFFYTLTPDEQKCFASIQKVDLQIKKKSMAQAEKRKAIKKN